MATASHHVEKIVVLRDDVLKQVSANLTDRWQTVGKNLHLEDKLLRELKMEKSDKAAYLMLCKWKKSCKEDRHVRLIQALSISGEASVSNEVLKDFLSQIIGQLLSSNLNMTEINLLAKTLQVPLVTDSGTSYNTCLRLMKGLFESEVITTNDFTKVSKALETQHNTLLSDRMKKELDEYIRKVQGTPESFNYLDFLYTLAETMKPKEVNSLCNHFELSTTEIKLVKKSPRPGQEFIHILRKKKILQKSDISELIHALRKHNYTKLLSIAEEYRTYKSLPQIWVQVTSAYTSNEIPVPQSLKTLGVFRIFKSFFRKECRGNVLESVAFGSLRFLLRVPSIKALDSLLKSVQSGKTAKAILSILKRELKEDKSRLPNKLLAKIEDGPYETTKEALKSLETLGSENIPEADPEDLETLGPEKNPEADPEDLAFHRDCTGSVDSATSDMELMTFDDTETIPEADPENFEEHHKDPSIQSFKQNMKSLLVNMTEFTRLFSSLYRKDHASLYQNRAEVERFFRLRDSVRDDAKQYVETLFPTYTGILKCIQRFCRYYTSMEFNEWYQHFDSIAEKVEEYCKISDDMQIINNECILKLREKEKETINCINNLIDEAKPANTGVIQKKSSPEEDNIESVVVDCMIPACKVFIDGINETSAFFVKMGACLSLLKDNSSSTSEATRKFHYNTVNKEAEIVSELCNTFFDTIPKVNIELSTIPEMSVSNALVLLEDAKAWKDMLNPLLTSQNMTPRAREHIGNLVGFFSSVEKR